MVCSFQAQRCIPRKHGVYPGTEEINAHGTTVLDSSIVRLSLVVLLLRTAVAIVTQLPIQ